MIEVEIDRDRDRDISAKLTKELTITGVKAIACSCSPLTFADTWKDRLFSHEQDRKFPTGTRQLLPGFQCCSAVGLVSPHNELINRGQICHAALNLLFYLRNEWFCEGVEGGAPPWLPPAQVETRWRGSCGHHISVAEIPSSVPKSLCIHLQRITRTRQVCKTPRMRFDRKKSA